ncbi:MAG: hypothetical protein KDD48_07680 [Bdellovibrionales bacterium]|nr:hypothetical protein [Bdellovibrionales bacterium]
MTLADQEKASLVTRLRWYTSFRLIMAFFLCLLTWIIKPGADGYILGKSFFSLALFTSIHLCMALFFFIGFNLASRYNVVLFSYIQIVWDTLFTTALVYLTGGIESHFRFLFWLCIMNAAFLVFRSGAIFAASFSAICYGLLANLLYLGSVPMIFEKIWHPGDWQENQVISSIIFNSVVFFIVALVSSHLADNYRESQEALAEKNIKIHTMEKKVREAEQLAAIGELAARIAHEIRNPLTSISGAIQMLANSNRDIEARQLMEIALRETDRLNMLLTEFLCFARPIMPQFSKIRLSKLIYDTYESFSKSDNCLDILFELNEKQEVHVFGDLKQLSQVFWNLFKNASEAMAGKGKLVIDLGEGEDGQVLVQVKDSGKGIPEDIRSKVFQPFFTTKAKGTGLGLSVVHRIIEQHHGGISVESNENHGSTFKIVFLNKDHENILKSGMAANG